MARVQRYYGKNGERYDIQILDPDFLKALEQPLKVTTPGECPKCNTNNPVIIEITRRSFHCHKCGFIQYTSWEEKPLTLEMINRPNPTNYNRRERKANGRFQEGQNG